MQIPKEQSIIFFPLIILSQNWNKSVSFVEFKTKDDFTFHPMTDLILKIHGVYGFYFFNEGDSGISGFYKAYKEFVERMEEKSVKAYRIFLLNL